MILLPYSLFLCGEALDPDEKPDVWVKVQAWYGIVSTGGQAGYALDKLTEMLAGEFPESYRILDTDMYMICCQEHIMKRAERNK